MPDWLVFILSSGVIVLAGVRLTRAGDAIADRTGLGKTWVGAVLVAAATSLPELATDFSAVRQGTASLAVGDLFGSGMANMLVLAVADLALTRGGALTRVAINQALLGALAISLTALGAAGIVTHDQPVFFGVGWAPLMIGIGYLVGMRLIFQNRAAPPFSTEAKAELQARHAPALSTAAVTFAVAALAILLAARYLASSAAMVATDLGISAGFMGVALLGLTTSLPEVTVAVTSLREGSYDLAVGTLLGSNTFNMVILLVLDLANGSAPLLAEIGPAALIGALFAILLMGQTLIEILNRAERRFWLLEPDAVIRIMIYAAGIALAFEVQR